MRSSFSSSPLVRLLGEWAPADSEPQGMDFAERLSLWVSAFDAIRLNTAQQAIRAVPAPAVRRMPRGRAASTLPEDLQRARGALLNAIAQDPIPRVDAQGVEEPAYAPYHQRHLELQRQMEQVIGALREHARQALAASAAPRLRQLAALDAALEQVLAAREQKLLPKVPALLQRRFEHLRQAHRQALQALGQSEEPGRARAPGGWLDLFTRDWRQSLLAELELRLEPVTGLVEAATAAGASRKEA